MYFYEKCVSIVFLLFIFYDINNASSISECPLFITSYLFAEQSNVHSCINKSARYPGYIKFSEYRQSPEYIIFLLFVFIETPDASGQ